MYYLSFRQYLMIQYIMQKVQKAGIQLKKNLTLIICFVALFAVIAAIGLVLDKDEPPTAPVAQSDSTISEETTTHLSAENFVDSSEETTSGTKEFTSADLSYLDDALFIGDSRTVGLQTYSDIKNADFFCTVGMNVFKIFNEKATVNGNSTDLRNLLSSKSYGKIYIMLGINELGYNRQSAFSKYKELVDTVRQLQSDAIIFIQANIHVVASRSSSDKIINNPAINEFNSMIASLENKQNIFYIDVNPLYDDGSGNLSTEHSSDGIHLYAKDFGVWKEFILSKAIV